MTHDCGRFRFQPCPLVIAIFSPLVYMPSNPQMGEAETVRDCPTQAVDTQPARFLALSRAPSRKKQRIQFLIFFPVPSVSCR